MAAPRSLTASDSPWSHHAHTWTLLESVHFAPLSPWSLGILSIRILQTPWFQVSCSLHTLHGQKHQIQITSVYSKTGYFPTAVRTSSAGPAKQTQHSQIKYMHHDPVTPCCGFLLSWQDYLVLGLSPTLLLVQPCLYWLKFHLCDVKIHSYTIYTD